MKFYVKEKANDMSYQSPKEVYETMKKIAKADQESFWVIGLNTQNKEVLRDCVSLGGLNQTTVDPKIIFKRLLVAGCSAFIVVHNHPSGNPAPSECDRVLTRRLSDGAQVLDLTFHDHLIVGDGQYYSFQETNFDFRLTKTLNQKEASHE